MDHEVRDIVGRALYNATADFTDSRTPRWDQLLNKAEWILRAEKVVEAYNQWLKDDIKRRLNIEREGE